LIEVAAIVPFSSAVPNARAHWPTTSADADDFTSFVMDVVAAVAIEIAVSAGADDGCPALGLMIRPLTDKPFAVTPVTVPIAKFIPAISGAPLGRSAPPGIPLGGVPPPGGPP